jgi:excisionase family DNA binding protein
MGTACELPAVALRALRAVLLNLGEGNAVQVQAARRELSTQELANLLNVSRPYVIGLLDRGEIPHRKVGKHRRVLLEHALAYKRRQDDYQSSILDTLVAEAQAAGDYD